MADLVKYLVTVDSESGDIVRVERLGSSGDLSEVPANAFSLDVSELSRPVKKGGYPASEAGATDDPEAIGPKGPAPVGPKAVGPKGSPPPEPEAIGPKGPGTVGPKAVGPKAVGPKGVSPQESEEDSGGYERESPEEASPEEEERES